MAKSKQKTVTIVPDETIIRKIYVVRGQKVMLVPIAIGIDLAALYGVETKVLNQAVKRNIERFPEDFMFRLTAKEWATIRSQSVITSMQDVHFQNFKTMRSQFVTASEEYIRSKFATSFQKKRNINVTPYAFTEHGIAMLASVIKSEQAVKLSIIIIKAFIELKRSAFQYGEITEQLQALKERIGEHDVQLNQIYDAIENILDEKTGQKTWEKRERIGFK